VTKAQIAELLAFASTLDGRLPTDSGGVEAWALVLDEGMDAMFALEAARQHYADGDFMLTPAHLNKRWRDYRKARAETRPSLAAQAQDEVLVPMPEWFRGAMREAFGTEDFAKIKQTRRTGAEIQAIFDRHTPPVGPRTLSTLDAHCGRQGCECTHTGPCYRGWVDDPRGQVTGPCRMCRVELAAVLDQIPSGKHRTAIDGNRIRNRYKIGLGEG
jgi:hypothetical protein